MVTGRLAVINKKERKGRAARRKTEVQCWTMLRTGEVFEMRTRH